MSIPIEFERLTPEDFRLVESGQRTDGRPVAAESGIGKKWDILIALFADGEDPQPFVCKALTGPPELIEDGDWFHALRLRDPAMTKQLARALESIDEAELKRRYYRVDLTSAYNRPDILDDDDFARVWYAFCLLRDFYSSASAAGDAVTFQLWG